MDTIKQLSVVRVAVLEQMGRIAEQQRKHLPPLSDDMPLMNTGLDSLCLAILVASLDDQLGIDPFQSDHDIQFPVTVGEFIRTYENASV